MKKSNIKLYGRHSQECVIVDISVAGCNETPGAFVRGPVQLVCLQQVSAIGKRRVDKQRPLRDILCLFFSLAFEYIFTHLCILKQALHQSPQRIHPSIVQSKSERRIIKEQLTDICMERITMQVVGLTI